MILKLIDYTLKDKQIFTILLKDKSLNYKTYNIVIDVSQVYQICDVEILKLNKEDSINTISKYLENNINKEFLISNGDFYKIHESRQITNIGVVKQTNDKSLIRKINLHKLLNKIHNQ